MSSLAEDFNLRTLSQLLFFSRNRENNKKDGRGRLGSRASSSNVAFPMAEKSKTGYYNVTPAATASDNLSGDYDYPDPQPDGSRNSHYDNPGLEKETGASRAVDDDPQVSMTIISSVYHHF